MKRVLGTTVLSLVIGSAGLVTAASLGEPALRELVSNKVWRINWAACMGGSNGCPTYWNFDRDGTICARSIGAQLKDKCADEGKWRIKRDELCWDLTWLGGGEGYKSVCVTIEKAGGKYVATRVGGIGVKFFDFSVD